VSEVKQHTDENKEILLLSLGTGTTKIRWLFKSIDVVSEDL